MSPLRATLAASLDRVRLVWRSASKGTRREERLGGLLIASIGALVLAGWMTGSRSLTAVAPGYIPVAPNTALLFLALGGSLCALDAPSRSVRRVARAAIVLSLIMAGARLAEYLLGADLRVDAWLFSFPSESLGLAPVGKMAFFTALAFVLACLALLAQDLAARLRFATDLGRALAVTVALIGLVFSFGYVYDAPLLYGGRSIPMALPTAIGFVVLGLTIVVPAVLRDQAEREAARHALRAAYDDLEARVARRTAELESANERLQDMVTELEEQASELESSQQEALAAQQRYQLLFKQNPLPMWVLDLETHRFLAVNAAAVAQYGYSREEFLAKTPFEMGMADDAAALEALIGEPSSHHGPRRIVRHRRKDDSVIDVEVVAHTLDFDGRDARLVLANDVTERVEAERELRRAHAMVATLLDAAPVAIIAVDTASRVTMWNPAAERTFGWTAAEVLGTPLPTLSDEMREEFARLRAQEAAGVRTEAFETRRLRKDGSTVSVYMSAAALRDGSGQTSGAVALFVDITERKRLEEQLRQVQKMEAVGQLAGGVAHDFNNVLTVITTCSEMLLGGIGETDPLRADVQEIKAAADRAAALTRQLLAFSRRQMLQPRVIDLNQTVAEMEKMLRRLIIEEIELVTVLDPGLGRVKADRGQIEQVIMNLVVNARDAMTSGGRLTIQTANVRLDDVVAGKRAPVSVPPGAYVQLAVSDTGCGMDEATKARIFDPFFTTKAPGRGTGLGLSTVYGIVKQSGGYIWVYSEVGRGTTFKIYLPSVDEPAERTGENEHRPVEHRGTETVLLVEDDQAVRSVARRILARQGYTVVEAENGVEALRACESAAGSIQLVISDMVMPQMSGPELAHQLRARHPAVRLLFMSGYTEDAALRQSFLEPGTAFIEKPFTPDALARRVREVLDSR